MSFEELNRPTQDASGYWVAQTKDAGGMYFILVDRIDIGYLQDHDVNDFFFEKESQCHTQAAGYYALRGGYRYPYMSEWNAALKNEGCEIPDEIKVEPETETMEFI